MGQEAEKKEEVERGSWDNQCDFFLSCMGYAVGLGNIWRFPYLCYQYGGVTFLIAYFTMLFLTGLPLFFLDLALGQYAGKGPIKLFTHMMPGFKGLGYGMIFISFLITIYYNVIIAWTLYYTAVGFSSELPWTFCGNSSLTSRDCFQRDQERACYELDRNTTFWDRQCVLVEEVCKEYNLTLGEERDGEGRRMCNNGTEDVLLNKAYPRVSPSEDYFKRTMLGLQPDSSWSNMGGLKWDLVLCLAAAWAIVSLSLIKGVQSSGKVVYFTALFPYFVLVVLLIRGATLDGAYEGIIFYIYPTADKIAKLQSIEVWAAAATQIFYSLGTSFGGLLTMASYNRFNNNCFRDSILIAFINCGTSIFAGFVIFSIIGFMAKQAGLPIEDVIKGGPGLVFIAYPEAVTQMPIPQLWSFLFFSMIITLGLDSQFTLTETITTAIMDQFPKLRQNKEKVAISTGIVGFLLGLTMCTRGGIFMFELVNWYSAACGLLFCGIAEVIATVYVYGHKNFFINIEEMEVNLPRFMKYYFLTMWKVLTPLTLIFVLVMSLVQFTPAYSPGYTQEKYVFPPAIQCLGWAMSLVPIVLVIIGAPLEYYKRKGEGQKTDLRSLFSPSDKWGPSTVTNAVKKQSGQDNQTYEKDVADEKKQNMDTNM